MAEYGVQPRNDDSDFKSLLIAGGLAAAGLFTLGHSLKPWAEATMRAEYRASYKLASRTIDKAYGATKGVGSEWQNAQNELRELQRHLADKEELPISPTQALGLWAARSSAMKRWTKFAGTNQIAGLADELGFVRLLREQYGMAEDKIEKRAQMRVLGKLGDLRGVDLDSPSKGIKDVFAPDANAYYAYGKIYARNKEGKFGDLPGTYMLFGRAAAGAEHTFLEKAFDELTLHNAKLVESLKGRVSGGENTIIETLWKEKAVDQEQFKTVAAFRNQFDFKTFDPHAYREKLTEEGFRKVRQSRWDIHNAKRALSRIIPFDPAKPDPFVNAGGEREWLHRIMRFWDIGLNPETGAVWTEEGRVHFQNRLMGILKPQDRPILRAIDTSNYDVLRSMEPNLESIKDALFGGPTRQVNMGTIGLYHLFRRINVGIVDNSIASWAGLSGKSTEFTFWGGKQIHGPAAYITNMAFKRALPSIAIVNYAGYVNDQIGNATGTRPSDSTRDARAKADLWWAHQKDVHHITPFVRHLNELSGGALGYVAHPFIETPVGLSEEQLRDFQANGQIPVRKGRWWSFGSSTPFRGERIQYWTPNYAAYGKAGDIYNSSTLWGSSDEYWANAALPTPTHPFAPIKHFITDRYHFEKKHYQDRPYPLTAPLFEATTPWGVVLNPTLGRLIKPTVHMHQQDLPYLIDGPNRGQRNPAYRGELRAINEQIKDQARSRDTVGFVTPGGAIEPMEIVPIPGSKSQRELAEINEDIRTEGLDAEAGFDEDVEIGSYSESGARGIVPYGSGKQKVRTGLKELNAQTVAGGPARRFTKDRLLEPARTPGLYPIEDPNSASARGRLIASDDPRFQAGLAYYSLTEIGGIYGFGAVTTTGDLYARLPTVANAGLMTGFERTYWDRWNSGGMLPTPGLSEAVRRFMPHRYHSNQMYNPIRNTMPDWLPGTEGQEPGYFLDFLHGDPYALLPNGETRLPGETYERLHNLPAAERTKKGQRPGQNYSDITRLAVLADVAPWSQQYKLYRDALVHAEPSLSPEDRARVQEIKREVTARKKRFNMTPYRASVSDLKYEEVQVKDVIDNNTFTTYQHPDNPIRLAGVHVPAYWGTPVSPGEHLKIGYSADDTQMIAHDTLHTIRSVVYRGKDMINRDLIAAGARDTNEKGPAGTHVRYSEKEIGIAKNIETITHMPIPFFHNKFMPIDSPLELYKRTQVYGKDWQDWKHPFKDYVAPAFESFAQQGLPGVLGAATLGFLLGNKRPSVAAAFAAVDVVWAAVRKNKIPEYRSKEREINEYFDILKYVKYEGLYEKTRSWIEQHQHHDIGKIADRYKREGEVRKRQIQILKSEKRQLIVSGKKEQNLARIKEINREIARLQRYREILPLSREDVLALEYKNMAETTLYGAEPGGDMRRVLLALDSKEREFFQAFLKAPGRDRATILKLVPQNERRFLEATWRMPVEERPNLSDYFKSHFLPPPDWRGWHADSPLDDYKLVVMKQEGLDLTTHGFWPQDEERTKEEHIPDLKPFRPSEAQLREQMRSTLAGRGLTDIDINLMPNGTGQNRSSYKIHAGKKSRRKKDRSSRSDLDM